ncbi:MAG: DUF4433 domain-containing protein [Luteitalea sp.]|nr:DUF4433 domain-containing protein [Luteitalea sp.]
MSGPPADPKIYHIIHVDRLASVVSDGRLWCDEVMAEREAQGTMIGMTDIKARRLLNRLGSRPGLRVGQCVPFYFCPRAVMLFLIHRANHPNLAYRGGQGPILHFEADLHTAVEWAEGNGKRWAFTLSNAGAAYFEDRCEIARLVEVNWPAVHASSWSGPGVDPFVKDGKQAEFLIENSFPWKLVSRIGVRTPAVKARVGQVLRDAAHRPMVEVRADWYY